MKKNLIALSILTTILLVLTSCVSDISSDKLSGNNPVTTEEANLLQESVSDTSEQNNETTNENPTQTTESTVSEETTTEKQNEDVISPSTETTTEKRIEVTPETTTSVPETTTANTSDNLISKQEAKEIALNHAGLKESDVKGYSIELDKEINSIKYEISFYSGNSEYEYEINAKSGKVIKSEKETKRVTKPQTAPETTTANTSDNLISKQEAKEIALNHAGLKEADIKGYSIELDREINSIKYEISFYSGNSEYEYEINAKSGKVIKSEKETKRVTKPQTAPETTTANTSDNLISKQEAKEIALNHAGLKEADIKGYSIELDRETNSIKYEISFYSGAFEYEYELNATNGKILQSEKEHID